MPIVSSSIVEDRAQIDGRRSVQERHVDHLGVAHGVHYLAESGANVAATMAARVAVIEAGLAHAEIQQSIGHIMSGNYGAVSAQHASLADIRAAIRALYQTRSGEIIGRLAGFLLTLSDANLRTLFNVTQGQIPALRSRLQAKVDALNVVLTMVGE